MAELSSSFFRETSDAVVRLKNIFPLLSDAEPDTATDREVYTFFYNVRTLAPFAGFWRCARLADLGFDLLRDGKTVVSCRDDLTACIDRIGDILNDAAVLGREPEGVDDDIVASFRTIAVQTAAQKDIPAALLKVAKQLAAKEKNISSRLEELDREKVLYIEKNAETEEKLTRAETQERENDALKEKLAVLEKSLNERNAALTELERDVAAAREDLAQKQKEAETQKEACFEKEQTLTQKEDALSALETQMRQNEKHLAEKIKENDRLYEELTDKMQKNEAVVSKNNADMAVFRQQVDNLKTMTVLLQEKYAEKMQANARLTSVLAETGKKNGLLEENTKKMAAQIDSLIREHQQLHDTLEQNALKYDIVCQKADFLDSLPLSAEVLKEQFLSLTYAAAQMKKTTAETVKPLSETLKNLLIKYTQIPVLPFVDALCVRMRQKTSENGTPVDFVYRMPADMFAEKQVIDRIIDILTELCDFAARHAGAGDTVVLSGGRNGAAMSFGVECRASFDRDVLLGLLAEKGVDVDLMTDEEALNYLATDIGTDNLSAAEKKIGALAGFLSLTAAEGALKISFTVPASLMFAQVLIVSAGETSCAVPLFQIEETIPFSQERNNMSRLNDVPVMLWRGMRIPFVSLSPVFGGRDDGYVVVVKSGVRCFAIGVEQVVTTREIVDVRLADTEHKTAVSSLSVLLENGKTAAFIDLFVLGAQLPLPVFDASVSVEDRTENQEKTVSFLVYKASPDEYQAIGVNDVSCIEDFAGFPVQKKGEKTTIRYHGTLLPVRDSSEKRDFSNARSLLILKNAANVSTALAIREVIDIVEVPEKECSGKTVWYCGKELPVVTASS